MDRRTFIGLAASSGLGLACPPPTNALPHREGSGTFVTRDPSGRLMLGGSAFRYIGANMPEVTHIRTDWDLRQAFRFRLPTTDEIDWMVEAAAQANLKVIRTWCFPSHLQPELPEALRYFHLNRDGATVTLNEEGFRLFDYFLWRCRELGIHAQVPFVYLYKERQWADRTGDPHPQMLDFVRQVVARRNTRSGIAYGRDPTILCWESGNETRPTARWVSALASFTKALAPDQLFADGRWGGSDVFDSYTDPSLAGNRTIDVVSVHTYEQRPKGWSTPEAISRIARLMRAQGRALDVGEIAPGTSPADLGDILGAILSEGIAGGSWWSFKGARAKGGYTQWNGRTYGGNDDLKWPGFVSSLKGVSVEKAKVDLLCAAAYAIEGRRRPSRLPRPTPAKLLPIMDQGHISWIPGTGEQVADIQRSTRPDRGFVTVATGFETFKGSTFDLFCDGSAEPGRDYHYRVVSRNSGGAASPSNVVGPVHVGSRWLIDDFWGLEKMRGRSPGCRIVSDYDLVPYHADLSVLKADGDGQHIDYEVPGAIRSVLIVSNGETDTVRAEIAKSGAEALALTMTRTVHPPLHVEFAGHPRVTYEARVADSGFTRLRVSFGSADVLSRLEIEYL